MDNNGDRNRVKEIPAQLCARNILYSKDCYIGRLDLDAPVVGNNHGILEEKLKL